MKRIATNVMLLFLTVFPVWFGGAWFLFMADQASGPWYDALVFYFIAMFIPLICGGLGQQLILMLGSSLLSGWRLRIVAVLTSVLIPAAMLLFGTAPDVLKSPEVSGPLVAGLLLYSMVMRLPSKQGEQSPSET